MGIPMGSDVTVPRVSVVIPAYNTAQYVGEAVDSVLAQTFRNFEIVVVNDGSPDTEALEKALHPYGERIRYVRKPNGGLSSARNAGIAASQSECIAFLDSDDTWTPEYLVSQLALLEREPTAAAVFPDGVYFGETLLAGKKFSETMPFELGRVTIEAVLREQSNLSYSCLARRTAIERVGGYDESLRRIEDWDMYLRLLLAGETILINPAPLLRYRRRDGSLSADGLVMRGAALNVLTKIERMIPNGSPLTALARDLRSSWRASIELELGRRALREGCWAEAKEHWEAHQRIQPRRRVALGLWFLSVSPRLLKAIMRRAGRI